MSLDTPRSKARLDPSTPIQTRVGSVIQSSPHYTTTRRHSLYGIDDRIVLDPGSRVWKVGFSGEGRPRDVLFATGNESPYLWGLSRPLGGPRGDEVEKILEVELQALLRRAFHDSLLVDPKSRKVVIVENALLPLYVKEMIARILFNNMQVPSISFASSHLLSLFAVGRITGLVLDCGYLESTALAIFAARPMFPIIQNTPLAGSRYTSHLRALLLLFGTYIPPLSSLGGAANIPVASRSMRVPEDVLTDEVMEEIKTRCCFVGEALDYDGHGNVSYNQSHDSETLEHAPSEFSQSQPESEFSRVSGDLDVSGSNSPWVSTSPDPSGYSVVSYSQVQPGLGRREKHLQALATLYKRHSTATDIRIKVDPPPSQQTGTGRGTLIIPGWVRERSAEVLFEGGDVDERSVAEVILDTLLKVPVDLRKPLASSILVSGGTAMLPGFIPRLQTEVVRTLYRTPPERPPPPTRNRNRRQQPPPYDPYAPLRSLAKHVAILNHPSPSNLDATEPALSSHARARVGKAPAFAPATMAWVGGSLAGAMKIGGEEIPREKWDLAFAGEHNDEDMDIDTPTSGAASRSSTAGSILPDWSRSPLPPGPPRAPRAQRLQQPPNIPELTLQPQATAVGA